MSEKNEKVLTVIETRTQRIWSEDGITRCINKKVDIHEIEDAIENVTAANSISKGEPYLMLLDICEAKRVSIAARKYYMSQNNSMVIACAMIIKSPVNLMIGRMFMGINKPIFPVHLVKSQESAIIWLKKQS